MLDLNKSLNYSYNLNVESAYIITVRGNSTSEKLSARCAASCDKVGMPYKIFEAIDGTSGSLKVPPSLENCSYLSWPKKIDQHLSISEVACTLSHFALWCHCVEIDQPIVILEHDAIMVSAYKTHDVYNAIVYLGCVEQAQNGWAVLPIPPHGTNGPNYHFMLRAHAYAIDPAVAKNMVAHIIKYGIHESLDIMLRADIFPVVQTGLFANEAMGETIITDRKKTPDGHER
jgi:hypothetical protein